MTKTINGKVTYAEIKNNDYNVLSIHLTINMGTTAARLIIPYLELPSIMKTLDVFSFKELSYCYLRVIVDGGIVTQLGGILDDNWYMLN